MTPSYVPSELCIQANQASLQCMIWGDIVLILIFIYNITYSFWKSYASTLGCFLQPQSYRSIFLMGFLCFFLFLSSDFVSCLYPSVLSLCLGVHWSSVVMWFCSLFVSWCLAPRRSVIPHSLPFPSSLPHLPERGPQRGTKLWMIFWISPQGFRMDVARCLQCFIRPSLQLFCFQ